MNENTLDFTILTKMEVSEYGYDYNVTDFSILLGSQDEGYWTNDRCGDGVGLEGTTAIGIDANRRRVGARPALPYSSISTFASNPIMVKSGMFEVEYGEYPQTVVSEDIAKNLEELYTNGTIKQTGKSYTTDSWGDSWTESPFEAQTFPEYEYNGKKYIRVKGQNMFSVVQRDRYFSDGRKMCVGEIYWVEVEPIKWLINEKTNMALSKNVIFAGVQYDDTKYYNYNFKQTAIKKFMDRYFSKEIVPSVLKKVELEESKESNEKLEEDVSMPNISSNLEDAAGLRKTSEEYVEAAINSLSTSPMENRLKEAVDYINNPIEESVEDLRKKYEEFKETISSLDDLLLEVRNNISFCQMVLELSSFETKQKHENIEETFKNLEKHEIQMKKLRDNTAKKMELYGLRLQGKIDVLDFRIKLYGLILQDKIDNIQEELIKLDDNESKKRK